MLKEEAAILKEHIHIERRQVNLYQEMKASLSPDDLMIQDDFAESYNNEQHDAIQSAYFGNQCFSIFTTCCYLTSKDKSKTIILLLSLKDQTMTEWLQ